MPLFPDISRYSFYFQLTDNGNSCWLTQPTLFQDLSCLSQIMPEHAQGHLVWTGALALGKAAPIALST